MNNLSKPEGVTRDSYDRAAKVWSDTHWTPKFWGEDFDRFYQLLPPKSRLLEIGCGAGRDAQELIAHGYDYTGTDISKGQIEEAKKNNPGARFEVISAYDLDFPKPFDGFWCAASLIHIPKQKMSKALKAIHNNMKPGAIGYFAMKEGDGEELERRPEIDNGQFLFVYWQREAWRRQLQKSGFKIISEGYLPFSERTKWLTCIVKTIAA